MSTPPPAEDLALVQAFVDAFNAGDLDRCLALTRPDFAMATAKEWPGGGVYEGQAAVRAFLEEYIGDWGEIRYEHSGPEAVGGRIVERSRWVGSGRTSGIETSVDFYSVWSVEEGLLARFDAFALRDEARAFAGAS